LTSQLVERVSQGLRPKAIPGFFPKKKNSLNYFLGKPSKSRFKFLSNFLQFIEFFPFAEHTFVFIYLDHFCCDGCKRKLFMASFGQGPPGVYAILFHLMEYARPGITLCSSWQN